jgi:hypothetical protein
VGENALGLLDDDAVVQCGLVLRMRARDPASCRLGAG